MNNTPVHSCGLSYFTTKSLGVHVKELSVRTSVHYWTRLVSNESLLKPIPDGFEFQHASRPAKNVYSGLLDLIHESVLILRPHSVIVRAHSGK